MIKPHTNDVKTHVNESEDFITFVLSCTLEPQCTYMYKIKCTSLNVLQKFSRV